MEPKGININFTDDDMPSVKELDDLAKDLKAVFKKYSFIKDFDLKAKVVNIPKPKEYFQIPSMNIHRDDISNQYDSHDNYWETKKEIDALDDETMQRIANNMTDIMMEQFYVSLKMAHESVTKKEETRLQGKMKKQKV